MSAGRILFRFIKYKADYTYCVWLPITSNPKDTIIQRLKSMVFFCMYCDTGKPIALFIAEPIIANDEDRMH